jgi:uncharacterized protein involved in type VI secretion and phage assembly
LKLPVEVIRTMSPFANAPHLRLDVSRPNRSLEVLSCKGAEVFNQPYSFELEVVSHEGALDAHDLLFSVAYLHPSAGIPGIHGHIQSIVRSSTEPTSGHLLQPSPAYYRITLGPRLGLMAYRHNQRVFQGMSAEQIIIQLLCEHGIDEGTYLWQRTQPCRERDFCAQYCESDLQLLQRLCAEENLHYYFLHTRSRHVVVFADQSEDSVPVLPLSESRQSATNAPGRRRISMHRACVVGGLFELVSLDDRNRLKVRFDWGNQGDGARFNDCWIPVDLALLQGNNPWWGGMEVIVSFRDDNPDDPFISNRLWDPDINPRTQPEPVSLPRRIITTRIDREMFLDESRQFTVDDELIVRMARNNEMHFRVGSSLVTIDSKSVSLSGLKIMLSSIAEAQGEGE